MNCGMFTIPRHNFAGWLAFFGIASQETVMLGPLSGRHRVYSRTRRHALQPVPGVLCALNGRRRKVSCPSETPASRKMAARGGCAGVVVRARGITADGSYFIELLGRADPVQGLVTISRALTAAIFIRRFCNSSNRML